MTHPNGMLFALFAVALLGCSASSDPLPPDVGAPPEPSKSVEPEDQKQPPACPRCCYPDVAGGIICQCCNQTA